MGLLRPGTDPGRVVCKALLPSVRGFLVAGDTGEMDKPGPSGGGGSEMGGKLLEHSSQLDFFC